MFPRLYAIVDRGCFEDSAALLRHATSLLDAGVTLVQYRDKGSSPRDILANARELQRLASGRARLILNDRADLCLAANCDGVHLGQDDLSPEAARGVVGAHVWVGVSTHNPQQLELADRTPADYLAIGPVYATRSKTKPDPVIGLDGVRAARQLTRKPLLAIGGITRANCREVLEAGADAVAVIADLLEEPTKSAQEFLRIFEDLG